MRRISKSNEPRLLRGIVAFLLSCATPVVESQADSAAIVTQTVTVPGSASVWRAGDVGSAPPEVRLPDADGVVVQFTSVTGAVDFGHGRGHRGPDQCPVPWTGSQNARGAISGIVDNGYSDYLVGVFLTDAAPTGTPPPTLDFGVLGHSFESLRPMIGQIFFIGDGRIGTGTGARQIFHAPAGATRLILGTADGLPLDNVGYFHATIAAEATGTPIRREQSELAPLRGQFDPGTRSKGTGENSISSNSELTSDPRVTGRSGNSDASSTPVLSLDPPVLSRDPSDGSFTLTLRLTKSTDLRTFRPMRFDSGEASINENGEIEFRFVPTESSAFFRIEIPSSLR